MKMKKLISLLISLALLLTVGCSDISQNASKNDTNDKAAKEQNEITIAIWKGDLDGLSYYYNIFKTYKYKFEKEKGVKVNFDIINGSYDDYSKKLSTKLYKTEGPTLIFVSYYDTYEKYINSGIALKVDGRIENLEKVYDSLRNEYFVPIGMVYEPIELNGKVLNKLGIKEPDFNWSRKDYLEIKEKWLNHEPIYLIPELYWELVDNIVYDLDILDLSNKKISLNKPEVIEYIKSIKEEINSGKYILYDDYKYENYYKMIFESSSDEYKKAREMANSLYDKMLRKFYPKNALKTLEMGLVIDIDKDVILPNVVYSEPKLKIWGFLVNRNGKNVELGIEFLNGLLSDEMQIEMFKSKFDTYPVSKAVESKIEEIEKQNNVNEKAVELRKFILKQIETGNYKPFAEKDKIIDDIEFLLKKEIAKFIFADKSYTDEEISQELQKLENKYNIWLNE
ncbi:extracellular solute-binding protein [Caloranaerobacter azorensis]|uniref:Extracellular solute-binding protein n=1 Tax=Caloranaerobacter azorensis TaxID=116090 RepID=A0A6P1YE52_9FIRM|nr:extracellular solute-binding protein [Caloranaerobacter azorensis]QIB27414.1 extracellular solute-binding protein [Caloranaerobacter azorensis]